jgi:hypothetical protein
MQVGYMFWIFLGATLIGLFLSTAFKRTEQVMTWAPIILIPQILLAGIVARIDSAPKDYISYMTLGRWGLEGMARVQDEATLKLENPYPDICTPPEPPFKIINSVYHPQPEKEWKRNVYVPGKSKPADTCVMTGKETMQPIGAIDALGFYEPDKENDEAEKDEDDTSKKEDKKSDASDESSSDTDTEEEDEEKYSTPAFLNKTLASFGIIGSMNLLLLIGIFYLLKRRDPL